VAARFWIGGALNSNWNENTGSVSNWSATSGGTIRVAPPTVSDDVTFDGAGGGNSASIVSAVNSCLSITFTSGFTSSLTLNAILTIASGFTDNTAHTWAGASGLTILTPASTATISSGGKTFPNAVIFSGGSGVKVLAGGNDWTILGTLTIASGTTVNLTTAEKLICAGGLTLSAAMGGTATINMTGGTWSGNFALSNNVTIAGNITISGSVIYNTGILTYSSGTVTTTSSTLTISASTTLNTNGISWNNITLSAAETITINSLLTITGTLTINASLAITFAGTAGFTAATFTCSHTTTTSVTLKNSITYTVTTAFNAFTSRTGAILTFTSDDGTLKAILTLNQGATCNVLANFTRIDASNGRAIWTFNGTVTTCLNIFSLTDLSFVTGKAVVIQGNSNF
jgi:fibronectin-binding autotransporter adhesin